MDIGGTLFLVWLSSVLRCGACMYRNFSVDMKEVCPLHFTMPEIRVGREGYSSVIISDGNYFNKWSGHNAFDCKFLVKASFQLGIMAVIQNMYLRRNLSSAECVDYIQFGIPKGRYSDDFEYLLRLDLKKDKWLDRKICGELSSLDRLELNSLFNYSIKSKEGDLYVYLHIERKPLPLNTTLRLEIVFTSYKECRSSDSTYRMCDDSVCIHKNYFGDLIVNCPDCKDENSCLPVLLDGGDSELNTKVTVTAVTSIFLSFFLFLGCMMLCRYFLLFRQWHQPAQVTTVEMTPPPDDESTPVPSAPAQTGDKDLPPAYETLFPDR